MTTAEAIIATLESEAVAAVDLNRANVVDVLHQLARVTGKVATSITDDAAGGSDATGGHVACLTESVMGITAGLCRIADAIGDLAAAVRERPFIET